MDDQLRNLVHRTYGEFSLRQSPLLFTLTLRYDSLEAHRYMNLKTFVFLFSVLIPLIIKEIEELTGLKYGDLKPSPKNTWYSLSWMYFDSLVGGKNTSLGDFIDKFKGLKLGSHSQKSYSNRGYYRNSATQIYKNNSRAIKLGLPASLTKQQWNYCISYFNGCCAVCGRQLNDLFKTHNAAIDHWIPLSYKGEDNPGTVVTNIVPLCHGDGGCNNLKNSTMPDVWLRQKYPERKARQIEKRIQEYFDSVRELEEQAC